MPAPTTSSALETAITSGDESAKLLPLTVTLGWWVRVRVRVRSVRLRRVRVRRVGVGVGARRVGVGVGLGLGLGLGLGTRGEVTFPLSAKMRPEIEELEIVRSPETLLGLGLGVGLGVGLGLVLGIAAIQHADEPHSVAYCWYLPTTACCYFTRTRSARGCWG